MIIALLISAGKDAEPPVTADPWISTVLPVAIAAIGLFGIFGAAVIAARSALRVRLMDANRKETEDRRAFQRLVVGAANDLILAQTHFLQQVRHALTVAQESAPHGATVDLQLDLPTEKERVRAATDRWREALAEAHLYGGGETTDEMQAFDQRRSAVVEALNAGQLREAERENQLLGEYNLRQIYRRLQLMKVWQDLTFFGTVRAVRIQKHARAAWDYLDEQRQVGEKLIEEAQAEFGPKNGGQAGG